jgi:hypothetical protein
MKKSLIFLIVTVSLLTISCEKDKLDLKYVGPNVVEFKNIYLEQQNLLGASTMASFGLITSENLTLTGISVVQSAIVADSIRIQLVGKQSSEAITITVEVDPSSTAVYGVDYNVVDKISRKSAVTDLNALDKSTTFYDFGTIKPIANSFDVQIPANKSSVSLYLVIPALPAIPVGQSRVLKLNLKPSVVGVSENYKQFTYTIKP